MELVLDGQTYQTGKLDAKAQFHLARRLAPAMWALGTGALSVLKQTGALAMDDALALGAVGPLVDIVAKMSNEESDYVLNTCLAACSRQQGAGWAKVYVEGGGLAFSDINLPVMLQLVVAVIRENLGNFLNALPTAA